MSRWYDESKYDDYPIIDADPLPNPQSEAAKLKARRFERALYQSRDDGGPVLAAEEATPLADLTLKDLQALARQAGVKVKGTKAELIERLS